MENKKNQEGTNDSLKLLAKTSAIVFVGIILSKILSYLFRVVIARYMHNEVYGLFSLTTSITECLIAIFTLGLVAGVVRYVSLYRGKNDIEKIRHITRHSLFIVTISSLIGGIFLFLSSNFISITIFHNSNLIIFLQLFSIAIPISVVGAIFLAVIQAYEKIEWYTIIRYILFNLIELIVLILAVFIFLYFNIDKQYAVIASYLFGALTLLIPSYFICKYKIPGIFNKSKLNKKEKKEINKEVFSYSWPLIFVGLITFIFTSTDTILLGIYKNASAVGIYNAAVPIALLLLMAPQLFLYLFLPLITREYAKNNNYLIKEVSKQIGKWIFMLNLPIFIIILLFPNAVINVLFGPEYFPANMPLRILAIGIFFSSIFMISENLLSMVGKSKIVLRNLFIVLVINIILNLILIPQKMIFGLDNSLGLVGASLATMFSYVIYSFLMMLSAQKYTKVTPIRRKMLLILIISLIPTLLLIYIRSILKIGIIGLIIEIVVFLAVYVLLLIFTKCLDKNDLMILNTIKNKIPYINRFMNFDPYL